MISVITSRETALLSEIESTKTVPPVVLSYFQARLKNRLHDFIISKFFEMEKTRGLTRADLARRIGRKPEVITRLLGAPGNWTLDTVSDLLIGIASEELELSASPIASKTFAATQIPNWAYEAARHTEAQIAQKVETPMLPNKIPPGKNGVRLRNIAEAQQ